jgi:hypothetical protein
MPPDGRRDGRASGSVWKAWLVPLILGGIALGLALAARFLWIEPSTMGLASGLIGLVLYNAGLAAVGLLAALLLIIRR